MDEKELLRQLNSLNQLNPDLKWKQKNREILLSQISASSMDEIIIEESFWQRFFSWHNTWAIQPLVACLIFVFLGAGAFASYQASKETKPGDSLYVAKMISEKTRATLTFSEEEKAKLNFEFASNRAQEIEKVLAESSQTEEKKTAKVEKLKASFKEELSTGKSRLTKITGKASKPVADNQEQGTTSSPNIASEDTAMIKAVTGKDEQGLQISSGGEEKGEGKKEETIPSTEKILDEAEELFDNNDFSGTVNKLNEAKSIIEQAKEGEVKGVSEYSTTTN